MVSGSRRADGVDRVLETLGEIVSRIRTVVVTGGITQYAVECPPSVAFVDADLVSPVLVGVQRTDFILLSHSDLSARLRTSVSLLVMTKSSV